jgi:hypothetical protein
VVRNHAFDSLTTNEWFSFLGEVQAQYNIEGVNDIIGKADEMASSTPI